ncbi:hypothetical protein ES705_26305 [subsurface metagenome]
MFKRILLVLALICMIVFPVFSQTGNYTTNKYFYLPLYGSFGIDEYNEYNLYMQKADTQIWANKLAFDNFKVSDISDVDLTDIANSKILKYNSTSGNWECEDDIGGGTVTTSGTPEVNDIARFTGATVIEGLTYDELTTALALTSDDLSDVASIAMLNEAEMVTGLWGFTDYLQVNREYDGGSILGIYLNKKRDGDPTYNVSSGDHVGLIEFSGWLDISLQSKARI